MNTRRLRRYALELDELREQIREGGDRSGAEELDDRVDRLREVADELDAVLAKLGNPPTDPDRVRP
jgi:hypothetical protein